MNHPCWVRLSFWGVPNREAAWGYLRISDSHRPRADRALGLALPLRGPGSRMGHGDVLADDPVGGSSRLLAPLQQGLGSPRMTARRLERGRGEGSRQASSSDEDDKQPEQSMGRVLHGEYLLPLFIRSGDR
jgi:hypothetical protein